jgi:hypothetical protein
MFESIFTANLQQTAHGCLGGGGTSKTDYGDTSETDEWETYRTDHKMQAFRKRLFVRSEILMSGICSIRGRGTSYVETSGGGTVVVNSKMSRGMPAIPAR